MQVFTLEQKSCKLSSLFHKETIRVKILSKLIRGGAEIVARVQNYGVRVEAAQEVATIASRAPLVIEEARRVLLRSMDEDVQANLAPAGKKVVAEDIARLQEALRKYEERSNALSQDARHVPAIGNAANATQNAQKLGSNLRGSFSYIASATQWLQNSLEGYTYDTPPTQSRPEPTYPIGRRRRHVFVVDQRAR
jgi:hypothetical protein